MKYIERNGDCFESQRLGKCFCFLCTGVVVHLDDPVMQLCDLYFVDPEWLCNLVAKVVAPRDSKHNPITNGVVLRGDLHRMVENDKGNLKLPSSMVPQFLR